MTAPRASGSLPPGYFESLYARDPDPWRFASSDYERGKYAATLAALPRERYGRALEVGCSIGVLTAALAPRCDRLLGLDVAEAALAQARDRCAAHPHVALRRMRAPGEWPDGTWDLILLSEVLYYLDRTDLARMADRVGGALAPGGDAVLVHWTGATDYPLSGDDAADAFVVALAPVTRVLRRERAERYRLDLLRRAG